MMDKSSVNSIKEYITKVIKKGDTGFYCLIHKDNTVFDIVHIFTSEFETSIQVMGISTRTTLEYLADNIDAEANIIDFVYLNDILIPGYKEGLNNF